MTFIAIFAFGVALGSFLNVLIDRLSTNRSFIEGRSYCENCKKTLRSIDLIPLVSFFLLRGKCRYCKKRIPARLFAIELTTGLIALIVYIYAINLGVPLVAAIFLFLILYSFLGIFAADFIYGIIPDLLIALSLIAATFYIWSMQLQTVNHLLAALGSFAFFFLLFALTRGRGMGFGDVKLSFILGLILGFPLIIVSLYMAFLTGAAVAIILVICRKLKFFGSTIPFGPFLILSTVIALFYGNTILQVFTTHFLK